MIFLHLVTAKIWGGGEQYVYNFCHEEKRRGNISYVVVDENQEEMALRFSEVAFVIRAKIRGLGGLFALNKILVALERNHVDGICCHSGSASLLSVLLKRSFPRIKLLIFRHNLTPNKKDFYHRLVQKKADFFICVSKAVYEIQIDSCYKEYQNKFQLIYSGVDEEKFFPYDNRVFSDVLKIGYAGRIIENKGVLVLLEAFKKITDLGIKAELLLAGPMDKSFKDKFYNELNSFKGNDRVKILGLCSDMNEFYNSLDIFVLPSIVKESFGLVLCEAMLCEVPVVTTNSGAQEEIITNEKEGIIVSPNNVEALFEGMQTLINNENKRLEIAKAGRIKIKKCFTLRTFIDKIEKLGD